MICTWSLRVSEHSFAQTRECASMAGFSASQLNYIAAGLFGAGWSKEACTLESCAITQAPSARRSATKKKLQCWSVFVHVINLLAPCGGNAKDPSP